MVKIDKEFKEYLYNFWLENFEDLCNYCKYYKPCGKDVCPKYENFGKPISVMFNGKVIDKESQPWAYIDTTCIDIDFGECEMLKDSPCHGCMDDNRGHFEWNGKIPDSMRCI